jgi:hypothetical protein
MVKNKMIGIEALRKIHFLKDMPDDILEKIGDIGPTGSETGSGLYAGFRKNLFKLQINFRKGPYPG